MSEKRLISVSDLIAEAHEKIQQDFQNINPVVGLNRGMRKSGIPADAITIDCLSSKKRLLLILHDHQPDVISYQQTMTDQDPGSRFESIDSNQLSVEVLYNWMKNYFS